MLSTRQAAERLGVTTRQVRRYVQAGLLEAQQLGDYSTAPWVITEASLERLLATRANHAQKARPPTPAPEAERSTP